ncbi:MAG: M48 family metallopeptidase [Betaproteobacteria bacterium]|nr:MAG: M48 family metallopeptidase [Betaproteobacteria bacterium]
MSTFDGLLYDGRNAAFRRVVVEVEDARVAIVEDDARAVLAQSDISVDAPVPGVVRRLTLPGGATIETADHAAVEASWPTKGTIARAAFWLESRWSMAVAAVLITASLVWLIVAVVLPLAAEPVARNFSPRFEEAIGAQTLKTIDTRFARPSLLPTERRKAIEEKFAAFVEREPGISGARLEFRRMPFPNAFALPGGTIVLTDKMVTLLDDDDALMAVLAHELGHLQAKHGMRLVLQSSGVAVLVTALAGDAAGMTILAAAMPAALLNARYSREFELEADRYAYGHLARHGSSPQALADVLRRFAEDKRTADVNDPLMRYLNSHPDLEERIRLAEEAR